MDFGYRMKNPRYSENFWTVIALMAWLLIAALCMVLPCAL